MLLAIDTSTRRVGLALYDGEQVLAEQVWSSRDFHTVELGPAVRDMLARLGLTPASLSVLAVALGPGSFTGLRIGLALAKGMALAHHLALVGIPTLDILAAAQPVDASLELAAVLAAGRGRLAVGWYRVQDGAWQASAPLEALTALELNQRIRLPTLVCGELTAAEQRLLRRRRKFVVLASPAQSLRRPSFLAELAWKRWQAGQVDDPATLAPQYLHYNDPIPD